MRPTSAQVRSTPECTGMRSMGPSLTEDLPYKRYFSSHVLDLPTMLGATVRPLYVADGLPIVGTISTTTMLVRFRPHLESRRTTPATTRQSRSKRLQRLVRTQHLSALCLRVCM